MDSEYEKTYLQEHQKVTSPLLQITPQHHIRHPGGAPFIKT